MTLKIRYLDCPDCAEQHRWKADPLWRVPGTYATRKVAREAAHG